MPVTYYKTQLENLCHAFVANISVDEKIGVLHTIINLLKDSKNPALLSEPFVSFPSNGQPVVKHSVLSVLLNSNLSRLEQNQLFPLQKEMLTLMFELDLVSHNINFTDREMMLMSFKKLSTKYLVNLFSSVSQQDQIFDLIKIYRQKKKQQLINLKPTLSQNINSRHAVDILMQVCYVEDGERYDEIKHSLHELYSNSFFQVMIDFLAVSALGKLKKNDFFSSLHLHATKPDFKVFAFRDSIATLFFTDITTSNGIQGLYNHNKSIYLTTANVNLLEIILAIMHEATHYVCLNLFDNLSDPFTADDVNSKEELANIFKHEVAREPYLRRYTEDDFKILPRFDAITDSYEPDEYLREFIVRVPEVMVLLGPQRGYAWLEKNRPGLLKFFEQHVVSKMKDVLQQHQANLYLDSPINYEPNAKAVSQESIYAQQKNTFFSKMLSINQPSFKDWAASLPYDDGNKENILPASVSCMA